MQVSGSNMISIHALREEGDPIPRYFDKKYESISIHALREEGDLVSTHHRQTHDISIHALREEGDLHSGVVREGSSRISIHALREEGDVPAYQLAGEDTNFYPRPPRGGRHARPGGRGFLSWISIHALREEGDPPGIELQAPRRGISIHALREEGDTGTKLTVQCLSEFLSTPSARRATVGVVLDSLAHV